MLKTILNLAWKELLQLFRDRVLLTFLILAPLLQLLLVAQSTGAGIRNQKLAVWDQDRSPLSQQLVQALDNTSEFQLAFRASGYEELQDLVRSGQAVVAVMIPPNFARDAQRPDVGASVAVIVDGTNVIVAGNILTALNGAIGDLTLQYLRGASPAQPPGGIDLKIDVAFNPTLNIRWSTLPTQLGFITYQLVLVVAAVSFVRERELGTMEQLAVTPLSRLQLLLGKGLMAALIGVGDLIALSLILTQGFQIPLRGEIGLLLGLGMLFIVAEIGVGLLVSVVSANQQQSILIVFLLAMLEISVSGYLVPTENMPAFMQFLAAFSPLQHFTAIVRAVFLKGASLPMLIPHVAPLALLATGSIGVAWTLFRRMEF